MTNLILIGYRGTGKTMLGKRVATKLNKEFIDTDELIVKIAGKSIPNLFQNDGEEKFREIETKALEQAITKENAIISCGGGIIVKERNFPLLKKGIVCLLTADEKTIFDRIYRDQNRPNLTDKEPFEEIKHLLKVRGPFYQKAKDYEVETGANSFDECIYQIITGFEKLINKKN